MLFHQRIPVRYTVLSSGQTRKDKESENITLFSDIHLIHNPLYCRFFECERRCDEDPCCRGIGYVKDTASASGSEMLCLTLNSLGIQTCGENDRTSWRVQDCSPSKVETQVYPFGWYEKPGVCQVHLSSSALNRLFCLSAVADIWGYQLYKVGSVCGHRCV